MASHPFLGQKRVVILPNHRHRANQHQLINNHQNVPPPRLLPDPSHPALLNYKVDYPGSRIQISETVPSHKQSSGEPESPSHLQGETQSIVFGENNFSAPAGRIQTKETSNNNYHRYNLPTSGNIQMNNPVTYQNPSKILSSIQEEPMSFETTSSYKKVSISPHITTSWSMNLHPPSTTSKTTSSDRNSHVGFDRSPLEDRINERIGLAYPNRKYDSHRPLVRSSTKQLIPSPVNGMNQHFKVGPNEVIPDRSEPPRKELNSSNQPANERTTGKNLSETMNEHKDESRDVNSKKQNRNFSQQNRPRQNLGSTEQLNREVIRQSNIPHYDSSLGNSYNSEVSSSRVNDPNISDSQNHDPSNAAGFYHSDYTDHQPEQRTQTETRSNRVTNFDMTERDNVPNLRLRHPDYHDETDRVRHSESEYNDPTELNLVHDNRFSTEPIEDGSSHNGSLDVRDNFNGHLLDADYSSSNHRVTSETNNNLINPDEDNGIENYPSGERRPPLELLKEPKQRNPINERHPQNENVKIRNYNPKYNEPLRRGIVQNIPEFRHIDSEVDDFDFPSEELRVDPPPKFPKQNNFKTRDKDSRRQPMNFRPKLVSDLGVDQSKIETQSTVYQREAPDDSPLRVTTADHWFLMPVQGWFTLSIVLGAILLVILVVFYFLYQSWKRQKSKIANFLSPNDIFLGGCIDPIHHELCTCRGLPAFVRSNQFSQRASVMSRLSKRKTTSIPQRASTIGFQGSNRLVDDLKSLPSWKGCEYKDEEFDSINTQQTTMCGTPPPPPLAPKMSIGGNMGGNTKNFNEMEENRNNLNRSLSLSKGHDKNNSGFVTHFDRDDHFRKSFVSRIDSYQELDKGSEMMDAPNIIREPPRRTVSSSPKLAFATDKMVVMKPIPNRRAPEEGIKLTTIYPPPTRFDLQQQEQ